MDRKMRFGIVGCGVISTLHGNSIAANPRAEIVAACDIIKDKADSFAQKYNVGSVYEDFEQMLKRDDIDVINVCVPSGLHADIAIAAAQAGKHILCEKPIDIVKPKMEQMIAEARNRNVKLGAIYQRRTFPAAIAAREMIQSGKLGKMVLGDAYLKYNRTPEYYKSAGWRGTWALDGGGALMNQGVHGVDLIQWMMGDIHSVFAYSAALVRDIEVEDTAVAVVKYKNGAFGVIQGTTSVNPGQETRFELHGNDGTIIFDDQGIKQWNMNGVEQDSPTVESTASASNDPSNLSASGHYILVDDMIQAVIDDRDPMVTGEEARKAVDVILAIYESSREGKEVIIG